MKAPQFISRFFAVLSATLVATAALTVSSIAATPGLPLFYTTGVNLGNAGWTKEWAIFSTGGGVTITASTASSANPSVVGDVGVDLGSLSISGNAYVRGRAFIRSGGTLIRSGLARLEVTPTTFNVIEPQNATNNTLIATASNDARAASTFASTLTDSYAVPGVSITGWTPSASLAQGTNVTINDSTFGQRIVLNLTDFILSSGASLTLNGSERTSLVINITGTFSLVGGRILLGPNVNPGNVLFNVVGTGTNVSMTSLAQYNGILLAPNRQVSMSNNSVINGTLIAGRTSMTNNSRVIKPTYLSP